MTARTTSTTRTSGAKPILPAVRSQVTAAYASGLTVAEISSQTGLDWQDVAEIIDGARERRRWIERPETIPPDARLVRCGGCGGMVELPCRMCRTRRLTQHGRLPPDPDLAEGPDDQGEPTEGPA